MKSTFACWRPLLYPKCIFLLMVSHKPKDIYTTRLVHQIVKQILALIDEQMQKRALRQNYVIHITCFTKSQHQYGDR